MTSYFFGGAFFIVIIAQPVLLAFIGKGNLYSSKGDEITYWNETLTPKRDGSLGVELQLNLFTSSEGVRKGVRRELPVRSEDGDPVLVNVGFCQRNEVDIECAVRDEQGARFLYLGDGTSLPNGDYKYRVTLNVHGLTRDVSQGYAVRWKAVDNSFSTKIHSPAVLVDFGVVGKEGEVTGFVFKEEKLFPDNPVQISRSGVIVEARTQKLLSPSEGFAVDVTWPHSS